MTNGAQNIERLFNKLTELAKNGALTTIKDIDQKLDIDLRGDKCKIPCELSGYAHETTLLGLATFEGNLFLVNSLLAAGANPNATSWGYRQLYTPAHLTVFGTSQGYGSYTSKQISIAERVEILRSLHKYNADLDWTGNDLYSWSPLYAADHPVTSNDHNYTLHNELLRLGANPKSGFYSTNFVCFSLACEEAAKKYQSNTGYTLPKHLHNSTLNTLMSFSFQYSEETQTLQVLNYENSDGKLINKTCDYVQVVGNHTDIFDLSEIGSDSILTAQGILDGII